MSADVTNVVWHKSSYSNGQAECVETCATRDGLWAVRDSKVQDSPALRFGADEWGVFIEAAKHRK